MTQEQNCVLASFHHTPLEGWRHVFHSILRAGHERISRSFPMRNHSHPGHELVMTLSGAGQFRVGRRQFAIERGSVGWIDYSRRNISWPSRSTYWEFLWLRIDSELLKPVAEVLCVDRDPIFPMRDASAASAVFENVFDLMRRSPAHIDAALHASVDLLVSCLFESRLAAIARMSPETLRAAQQDAAMAVVLDAMRLKCGDPWTVESLAKLAGVSASHFFNRFRKMTGSSPMNWLRRERINRAKRGLCETADRIQEIAQSVGYNDPLYFSRDFRRVVGVSPRQYRQRESSAKP